MSWEKNKFWIFTENLAIANRKKVKIDTIYCEVPLSFIYRWIEFDDVDI